MRGFSKAPSGFELQLDRERRPQLGTATRAPVVCPATPSTTTAAGAAPSAGHLERGAHVGAADRGEGDAVVLPEQRRPRAARIRASNAAERLRSARGSFITFGPICPSRADFGARGSPAKGENPPFAGVSKSSYPDSNGDRLAAIRAPQLVRTVPICKAFTDSGRGSAESRFPTFAGDSRQLRPADSRCGPNACRAPCGRLE